MLRKILFVTFIQYSLQLSTPSSPTYDAAIVEFNFGLRWSMDANEKMEQNLQDYLKIMDEINPPVDIVIFPEMTLNSMETAVEIPEISENISPCTDAKYEASNLVKKLSCSARDRSSYVLVNIVTKAQCPDPEMIENRDPRDCNERDDGFSYYNTNVVFDRKGVVASRYRKFNLFGEPVDKPYKPHLAKFTTDFGVTFGHFICFDMMFRYPAVELIRSENITDILFSTMWFSEGPFLISAQVQQNWAHAFNVNLLAANGNFPAIGSSGSGIYGGNKGAYVLEMTGTNKTSVHRATVYKKIPENEEIPITHKINKSTKDGMKTYKLKRDQLDVYDMTFLDDSDGVHSSEKNICKNGFCCSFKVNYTIENSAGTGHYQYAMAFNHGQRTFDGFADGGIVACAILACPKSTIASCGIRDESLQNIHVWNSVEINGKFPTTDGQFLYIPTSLDTSIVPLQPEHFQYKVVHKNNEDEISIKLNEHVEDLLVFGLYGRDFNLDSGTNSILISGLMIIFALITVFKLL